MNTLKSLLAMWVILAAFTQAANGQTAPISTGPYATEGDYLAARYSSTVEITRSDALGLVRAVELQISDQVDGGCWTNADAIQARIRAELERSGVAVFEEPIAFRTATAPRLELVVLGYRLDRVGCIATAQMELKYPVRDDLGSLGYTGAIFAVSGISVMWDKTVILSSGGKLDEQVLSNVQEWIDTLNADIAKGKRASSTSQFLKAWNKELPMTEKEWNAMLVKLTAGSP